MQSIRPWWPPQLKGRCLPSSIASSIAQTTWRTRPCRVTCRDSVLRRWSSTGSPERAFQQRVQAVKESCADPYPRLRTSSTSVACSKFRTNYNHLANNETVEDDAVTVNGRIRTYRLAGNKLIFFDIIQDGHKVQIMCNLRRLEGVTSETFKIFYRLLRRGDAFSITGRPHRTGRGELTVVATELPSLLSPCLHDIPLGAQEHEISPYPHHVQFLADQSTVDVIKARAAIIQYLRQFFIDRSFIEVSTPILNGLAGGAAARPFYTSATEFPDRQLSLRIAPELWLKRLVVGGFDKVFEVGPSFRNEGLDKTHNPEFTTCEFYHAYSNLEDLMSTTEELLSGMAQHIKEFNTNNNLTPTSADFTAPFARIDFISSIEAGMGRKLPDLTSPTALSETTQLFIDLSLPLPENPTLPRLLDELCSIYVEPQCKNPTFIINPPECLSPLSKTFTCPENGQRVAARAELFIEGKEVVNTYEEENSPFEQRRKFEDQLRFAKEGNEPGDIDEEYLKAMEWGLPPTGGWGCGVDRLVMMFTGRKRIADVLPFGNLRSVTRR
ncbi:putative lysyl-tRNA synthetase [Aspergillus undulatus]|uniref:putative lysyl-tRNA synthetase n=1 Tax=Aspergillus undulatus TaxID=1810928 RepID=UPI003CCD99BF